VISSSVLHFRGKKSEVRFVTVRVIRGSLGAAIKRSPITRNQPKNICGDASVARFAGSAFLFKGFLGFRFASPQALCFRLLRRLWLTNYFVGPVSELFRKRIISYKQQFPKS
jgi:hypothetical protein